MHVIKSIGLSLKKLKTYYNQCAKKFKFENTNDFVSHYQVFLCITTISSFLISERRFYQVFKFSDRNIRSTEVRPLRDCFSKTSLTSITSQFKIISYLQNIFIRNPQGNFNIMNSTFISLKHIL